MTTIAIPTAILETCFGEAGRFAPLETGGIFLQLRTLAPHPRVDFMVGAGPAATRGRTWLVVDEEWQNREIARLWEAHGPLDYIGEWHSHPSAINARPSRQDIRTMTKLARFPELRCPHPIMMITYRDGADWSVGAWELSGEARFFGLYRTMKSVQVHSASDGVDETHPR